MDSAPDGCPWFVPSFRDVFTQGVRMDFVDYPVGSARSTHAAVQCLAHEAEMNKFQESTVMDKARSARRNYKEVGHSWDKVRTHLLEVLGSTKRSIVTRWITIVRDVDDAVLAYITEHKDVPHKYITENKFLVGTGPGKRVRLKPESAIAALIIVFEKFEQGLSPPPAQEFINQC